MKKIMIMSGEASGDLHGSNLAKEIRKADPSVSLYGVGSRYMREAGVQMVADASEISVVGISEVLTHIGAIYSVYTRLKQFLRTERPDLLVLIDFPDFNIMLGKAARKLGIPVVYYISPQVWIWRKGRIKTIAKLVRSMLVVFPFEVPLYEKAGVDVRFVGHPLTDVVRSNLTREQAKGAFGLGLERRTVALLPGSRKTEIVNLLPDMLAAAKILLSRFDDLEFVLPVAPTVQRDFVRSFVEQSGVPVTVTDGRVYDVLRASDAAMVKSGTATLETGLMGVPMVIVYRISAFTYYVLSKMVSGIKHVGLVNIVADDRVVPELIQDEANPQNMADAITEMFRDRSYDARIRAGLAEVRNRLGDTGASARVAAVVLDMLKTV
ncbi:MAG: lipid-A-disaccharide synthase [Nitrospirae bacterium GWC2_57_9]|nr:MAG: lipid-A-disaccharide synthase [Nitrospirae bacterium GWC2_57_9]